MPVSCCQYAGLVCICFDMDTKVPIHKCVIWAALICDRDVQKVFELLSIRESVVSVRGKPGVEHDVYSFV